MEPELPSTFYLLHLLCYLLRAYHLPFLSPSIQPFCSSFLRPTLICCVVLLLLYFAIDILLNPAVVRLFEDSIKMDFQIFDYEFAACLVFIPWDGE